MCDDEGGWVELQQRQQQDEELVLHSLRGLVEGKWQKLVVKGGD